MPSFRDFERPFGQPVAAFLIEELATLERVLTLLPGRREDAKLGMAELLGLQKEIQVLKKEYVHAHRCEAALAGVYPRWNLSGVPQFTCSYHKSQ